MPAELTPPPPLESLAAIAIALDQISPWPWATGNGYGAVVNPRGTTYSAYEDENGIERGPGWKSATEAYGGELICESVSGANREFIADAPGRIARLLAEVDRYRALVEGLTAGADVLCMRCVVALQVGGPDVFPTGAVVSYEGRSLCIPHFNLVRGYPASGPQPPQGDTE
jgi:hypothetical protein